jgi:hypothetical protein
MNSKGGRSKKQQAGNAASFETEQAAGQQDLIAAVSGSNGTQQQGEFMEQGSQAQQQQQPYELQQQDGEQATCES